ncbi:MAG TPA: alpha/beta fold hydrolase, partial [Fimbriimonadaceae bacterium]|nr:alpha/beta fold hydrolase [Fimbriimonadaceae bacterium]
MLSLIALAVLTGSSAAPMAAQEGRTWVCKKPYLYGINAWGNMAEGTWMKEFSVSASGVSFTDPAGQGSGSASWEGPPLVLKEGQKVEISMQASKMLASFTALRCADNKLAFSKGVRDPWNPPVSSASFSFEFTPAKGVDKVTMRIEAKPTEGGPFYSCGGGVAWTFEPGSASDVVEQGATLSAVDARTWHDKGGFRLPAKVEGTPSMMGTYLNDGAPLRGVAADGVSLVLLRASVGKEGKATFDVSGAGGALYPMVGENPLRSPGSRTLAVETRRIASDKHAAFALYRPPSYFGSGKDEPDVVFGVQFGGGAKTIHKIKLVRPPVVLVHGTYDNPRYCWEEHDAASEAPTNLAPRLRAAGFKDVFCVDWEETNGHKDPSDFETNRFTVFSNKDGIRDALNAMRGRQIAVTQADLVCHSQGGVISRMYARGYPFSFGLPADHPHLNDPENCKSGTQPCWYHRAENYWAGDIHRIVTISTTHRGSHVCNLFPALDAFPVKSVSSAFSKLALSMFLNVVDYGFSAITTGGFYNQQPMSLELRSMGPTPVPAHAIACVGTDQDMLKTRPGVHGMGDYYFKLYLVLTSTPNDAQ